MKLKYLRGKVEINKDGQGITVVMSDETLDRHGDVLPIDQWDLTKFMMSPRMLVDHNHEVSSIVGKWDNTRIEGKQLMADANFHDFTDLAIAVKKMVQENYLDTVSVGFIPKGPTQDGGKETFELIETSWVTVPANPSARTVKELLEKQTPDEQIVKVKSFLGEKPEQKESEFVDMTPEAMIEMGWDIIKSVEDFQKFLEKETPHVNQICLCETQFIQDLLTDSKKLSKLTSDENKKVEASKKARFLKAMLQEVAKGANESLRELKGVR